MNLSEIDVLVDGKKIGKMQTPEVNIEYEDQELRNSNGMVLHTFTRSKTYSIELQNVQIDKGFINQTIDKSRGYKVVGEGYKLPRGNKLPKKKRIRKKWKKKYGYTFELDNCYIR